jgi:transcriptional regulator with XRE-family HTH domain
VPFGELLSRAGLTKAELARRLGVTANAVSKWGNDPPRYAVAYLELLVEYNRVRP